MEPGAGTNGASEPGRPAPWLVLASASPRRHALLRAAGVAFEVDVAGVDEDLVGDPAPEVAARELALRKARAVAGRRRGAESEWVVGADTVVALALDGPGADPGRGAWRLLGKPADEAEAGAMLAALSGSRHAVVTGVAVVLRGGGEPREWSDHETTWVSMRALSAAERDAYVASGEWRDKAGGYALQESADAFVTALDGGGHDNVVGLPVARTLELLRAAGAPLAGL